MFKFSKSDFFNFEFLRVLAVAPFYGAETGECLESRTKITDGDPESWYRAWTLQAERAVKIAEEASKHGDRVEASWAFIRAANYYRSSEFFLHCDAQDPRILDAIQKSSNVFERGVRLLDGELYTFDIPFEDNISLPARLFLPPAHKRVTGKLPILVQNGGFDSTQEELYFYGPAGGLPRGYAVLTYDGPGQGIFLRRDKTRMVPDWERVTAKVLDYLESKLAAKHNIDMDRIAVMGASLGGYLVLRVAGDPRVKAAISVDGCYDLFDVTKSRMPNWFIGGWLSGWLSDGFFNFVVNRRTASNFQLRWEFGHSIFESCAAIIQSSSLPKDSQISLIFSDRPENDFVALSSNIAAIEASQQNQRLFAAMVPKSFYQQIAPSASVSIGFSLACLHHLEHVPPLAEGKSPVDESRISVLRQQSHSALERFLNHRAAEIAPGGALILSFVAQASTGEENYAGLVDACRRALMEMLQAGLIPMAAATAFEVPTYNRTLQDLEDLSTNGVPGKWIVEEIFEKRVVHPAGAELRARQQNNNRGPQTVVSGYFLKALRVGLADAYTESKGQALLAEWVERTKNEFLAHHKDEDVNCWFIYVHLKRL